MDHGQSERPELSIPSFASERCRAMTTDLMRTLGSIPPIDDQALEDRALACFVVACGELALMHDIAQRNTVVEQLTIVARKLVATNAARPKNPAQGLAQGLMRGLLRGAPKGRPLQAARRAALDISIEPPAIPSGKGQGEAAQGDAGQGEVGPREIAATEAAQADTAQAKSVKGENVQAANIENIAQGGTAQGDTAATEWETTVEAIEAAIDSPAALSWDQLEALIKQEKASAESDH